MKQIKIVSKANRYLFTIVLASSIVLGTRSGHVQNIYVTKSGCPAPTGEQSAPYHIVKAGIEKARSSPGSNIIDRNHNR